MGGTVCAGRFILGVVATKTKRNHSRAEISASKIQSQMLEVHEKTWEEYFPTMRGIMGKIEKCSKDVKKIRTSTLVSGAAIIQPWLL
jgi:hypothetical protein